MNDAWIKMGERARTRDFGNNRKKEETGEVGGENRRGDKREIIGERRN